VNDRAVRWAGLAGIVFVVLIVVTIVVGGSPPKPDDSAEKIRQYFVDHRGGIIAANFVGLFLTSFVIWFAVVLRELLRGDRASSALGTASLAGILVTAPLAVVGGALQVSAVYVDGTASHLSDDLARLVYSSQALCFAGASSGLVVFAAATAMAIRRTRALPSYLMWLALLAVVGNVVAFCSALGAGSFFLGFVGIATFALFVLVAGITMVSGKVATSAA
jgi:hypothetical protein